MKKSINNNNVIGLKRFYNQLNELKNICDNYNTNLANHLFVLACDGLVEITSDISFDSPLMIKKVKATDIMASLVSIRNNLNEQIINEIDELMKEIKIDIKKIK